jgi:hypothetical protein
MRVHPSSDGKQPSFIVSCRHCQRLILTTPRIGDAGARVLLGHLRTCASTRVSDTPDLAEVLSHFVVTRDDR